MTDALTKVALVGTERASDTTETSRGIVDDVLASLAELPADRRLLLAAGARAAAAMAGRRAVRCEKLAAPAPLETRPACSPKVARLVGDMLRGHRSEVLPEALALLSRAGQRLPHALLPEALRAREDQLRAAIRPVLGERGLWLARLNEAWSWAAAAPPSSSIDDLERAFVDGTPAARRELLVRSRALDPARARAWLEATWSSEKADERARLLAGLGAGISRDDEPFLEAQLKDRSATVREVAQSLLPHIPESAFVQRMTARADAMLDYKRSALAALGKRGTLSASPPEKADEAAERDGFTKPPPGTGARAFWLTRALAAVPLAHWTTRFGETPALLVAAAEGSEWASAIAEGWTQAALVSGDADWLRHLWDSFQRSDEKAVTPAVATGMSMAILRRMRPDDAAARVEGLFGNATARINMTTALSVLSRPWPASVGMRFLRGVRDELRGPPSPAPLLAALGVAARALPAACFERALEPIELPESHASWERSLSDFVDIVRIRQDLAQEIAP